MLVAIDVDSTLYDSSSLFALVAEEHYGVELPVNATNWHDYYDYAPVETLVKIFRKAHSKDYVEHNTPYADAAEVCQMIADKGHRIVFVSDRHPQAETALRNWLIANEFPTRNDTDEPKWCVIGKDKRNWLSEVKPDIVIDDRVRTMLFAHKLGAEVFSVTQPWNVNLKGEVEGIHVCDNWQVLGRKIEEFI
jgi:phosphoglycolate phosphatase-like HAD superfamily hydrolase